MRTHQLLNLHAPLVRSVQRARGLGAPLPLAVTINSPYQIVGQKPTYTIIGAVPGAPIYWSSFFNGQSTGEYNASYGQAIESNGTARIEGGAWTPEQTGTWTKEILVQAADGTNYRGIVQFVVTASGATPSTGQGSTTPPASSGGGILDTLLNDGFYLGNTFIPYALAGGGAVLAFLFMKKR